MGFFDGNPFDFNGDGKTDALEYAMAMCLFEDMEKEERDTLQDEKDSNGDMEG